MVTNLGGHYFSRSSDHKKYNWTFYCIIRSIGGAKIWINIWLSCLLELFLTAFSQLLLKQSANKEYSHPIFEYLNWHVITAYGIFGGVLLLNTYAFTHVDMKYGSVIDTFSYVFVMLLSYFILKEKFTRGKIIGNLIIIAGIFVYTLG